MTLLNTLNVGGTEYGVAPIAMIATCETPAGTEVKSVSFTDNFELTPGLLFTVKFTYANAYGDGSATYPKLSILGANYPVKLSTGAYAGSGAWANGQTVLFQFDGTNVIKFI